MGRENPSLFDLPWCTVGRGSDSPDRAPGSAHAEAPEEAFQMMSATWIVDGWCLFVGHKRQAPFCSRCLPCPALLHPRKAPSSIPAMEPRCCIRDVGPSPQSPVVMTQWSGGVPRTPRSHKAALRRQVITSHVACGCKVALSLARLPSELSGGFWGRCPSWAGCSPQPTCRQLGAARGSAGQQRGWALRCDSRGGWVPRRKSLRSA